VLDVRGQQEDVALPDLDVRRRLALLLHHPQHHVALELVEELLDRVVVEVGPLVGTADHGDHEIGVLPDLHVADRRLQQVLVLVDPGGEVERLECTHVGHWSAS
jgi:hypothetical protein